MFDIESIQAALQQYAFDGWLLYDFRNSNVLARRVLGLDPQAITSRRFGYLIPAQGKPQKLAHRIESTVLDHLPGEKTVYLTWQEWEEGIATLLAGVKTLAMEYSPRGAIPYVSRVDAGTVDLVRDSGVKVVSSGDLVQLFEATWDEPQWQLHLEATQHTTTAFDVAWSLIERQVNDRGSVSEIEVQQTILDHFAKCDLITDHPPIVAVGPHSGDPHYAPSADHDTPIQKGDFVLIDLWAKLDRPRSVYSDLTRVGFVGDRVPEHYEDIFRIVAAARDAAIERVRQAFDNDEPLQGWQVDRAARDVIQQVGYGEFFVHRTGHSIGQETHGNGANMDDLETRDQRRVLRNTCFSIEPGIYLPEFGVRSEVDLFVDSQGTVHVTGGLQTEVKPILNAI